MQPAKGQVEMTREAAAEAAEVKEERGEASNFGMDNAAFVRENSPRNGAKRGKNYALMTSSA